MSTNLVPLSQIESIGGDLIPAGKEFDARCIGVKPAATELAQDGTGGGKLHVQTKFLVIDGDYEGLEFTKWHWVTVSKSAKNGKLYAPGATELMDLCRKVGRPLPDSFGFPMKGEETMEHMKTIAKALGERLHPQVTPRIRFKTIAKQQETKNAKTGKYEPQFNEDGSKKMRIEYAVLGVGGSAAGAKPSIGDLFGAPAASELKPSTDADPLAFG